LTQQIWLARNPIDTANLFGMWCSFQMVSRFQIELSKKTWSLASIQDILHGHLPTAHSKFRLQLTFQTQQLPQANLQGLLADQQGQRTRSKESGEVALQNPRLPREDEPLKGTTLQMLEKLEGDLLGRKAELQWSGV
jgi:hypothetical protein